jgi:ArsR family transcriptional regulator, repressor of sdpIR and other operons
VRLLRPATGVLAWSFQATGRSIWMTDARAAVEATEQVFSALAHPSRRHILLTLQFRGGEMSAGEIAERFECSWPTTTRHLNVLREAKLISVVKRGRERVYKLERARLRGIVGDWMSWFTPGRK